MSLRRYTDPSGRVWLVWKVSGGFHPVRSGADRRSHARTFAGSDRRSGSERRGTKSPPPWAEGWLCFETRDERRRLLPVPEQWEECSDDELERYRQLALLTTPVAARKRA